MTQQEKAKEKKQLQALIDCLRTENDAIGNKLAKMIHLVCSTRASQLGIELILKELEKKL